MVAFGSNKVSTFSHLISLRRGVVLMLLAFFLTACTAKLVYRNLDWVIIEFIEDYVTLNGAQEEQLDSQLEGVALWHKTQELPLYQQQLQILYDKNLSNVDISFLEEQQQVFRQHIKRLAERITPDLYLLARSLSDKQIVEFIDNLDQRHQDYTEKYAQMTEREIRAKYQERINKNLRRWLGGLTEQQQITATQWANSIELTQSDWAQYRLETRDRVKTLFSRRDDPFFFQTELTTLVNDPEQGYSDSLSAKLANNRMLANQSILDILDTVTGKQKAHFKSEVEEWLNLVRQLQNKS